MSNTEETRTEFHQLMDEVRGDLVRMSGLVTEGISTVTQALLGNDIGLADQISSGDDEIDLPGNGGCPGHRWASLRRLQARSRGRADAPRGRAEPADDTQG